MFVVRKGNGKKAVLLDLTIYSDKKNKLCLGHTTLFIGQCMASSIKAIWQNMRASNSYIHKSRVHYHKNMKYEISRQTFFIRLLFVCKKQVL